MRPTRRERIDGLDLRANRGMVRIRGRQPLIIQQARERDADEAVAGVVEKLPAADQPSALVREHGVEHLGCACFGVKRGQDRWGRSDQGRNRNSLALNKTRQ